MGKMCPACNQAELVELVPMIHQCPKCRKIIKSAELGEKVEEKQEEIHDGTFFMKNTSLNPKWEIAEKGITVAREKDKWWIAVLLCHSPDIPTMKYIRISWWKKSINMHAGMIKIEEIDELDNFIIALKRIYDDFDENFEPIGKISSKPHPDREDFEINQLFDEKKKICPKCKRKMKRSKNHRYYECELCGEIIVLEEGHPIMNVPNRYIPLSYASNFPVNYYYLTYGISTKVGMADWKAAVIIYSKDTPEKKWLRLYWWNRNLQKYISSKFSMGLSQELHWETRKGIMSPNIYEKTHLKHLIEGLEKIKVVWLEIQPVYEEEPLFIRKKIKSKKSSRKKSSGKKSTSYKSKLILED